MSLLHLICTAPHAAIPAITVGVAVTLNRTDQGLEVRVPGTPSVLARIAQAFRDGALVITDPTDPLLREMERQIMADRDRLLAEADALLSQIDEARRAEIRRAG